MSRDDAQFHAPPPVKQENAVVLHTLTGERIFDIHRSGATLTLDGVTLSAESVRRLQVIVTEAVAWGMSHAESEQGE